MTPFCFGTRGFLQQQQQQKLLEQLLERIRLYNHMVTRLRFQHAGTLLEACFTFKIIDLSASSNAPIRCLPCRKARRQGDTLRHHCRKG